jgi:hypothetical protein
MTLGFVCPVRTTDQCEALALARIPLAQRLEESRLYTTCWFDYRHLHPVQRTYHWTFEYILAIRAAYRATKDATTADQVHPFRGQDIFATSEWMGALLSRQKLDAYGIRYGFALGFAMTRFANRGWKVFPRPNQLYGEELIEDINDAWINECKTRLQIAEHPDYKSENFTGTPDQLAYRAWLNEQLRMRVSIGWALATPIRHGIYSTEDCTKEFGAEASRKATTIAAAMISQP